MKLPALVFGLALPVLLFAGSAPADDRDDGIRTVIGGQIEAFRADDFPRAFDFASPMIREMFRTPENFGQMVRNGYPMVWRPAEVRMGELAERGGKLFQQVILRDASGRLFVAEYEMVLVDGRWRINGVWIRPAEETGA
jgi:hypothetical protein